MKKEYFYKDVDILKVENVSLAFDGKLVLRDINITIKDVVRKDNVIAGQIIGLLGPSGRGKTQLFKIISGLRTPTTGTVMVNGKPVEAGDVGVVAQNYPLFNHMSVTKNLEIALAKSKMSKGDKKDKIKFYLEKFQLSDKADFYPTSLSGGQKQRIAIIQQLMCSEHFILLDEPFSGLDPNMIKEVSEVILELANLDELNTVIVISHDIVSTAAISNELWILGFDYDAEGKAIPGARIKYLDNLMEKGIAWNYPQVFELPEFNGYVKDVRTLFKSL